MTRLSSCLAVALAAAAAQPWTALADEGRRTTRGSEFRRIERRVETRRTGRRADAGRHGGRFDRWAVPFGRADAEIDSLQARLVRLHRQWRLQVRYEVEIEDASPGARFVLVLGATEHGRPLLDRSGRPLTITVPLVDPTDVDGDELEFENTVSLRLMPNAFRDVRGLRLRAKVVCLQSGRTLDREDTAIKVARGLRKPKVRIRNSRLGFSRTAWRR
jgi:hypothetical protein